MESAGRCLPTRRRKAGVSRVCHSPGGSLIRKPSPSTGLAFFLYVQLEHLSVQSKPCVSLKINISLYPLKLPAPISVAKDAEMFPRM